MLFVKQWRFVEIYMDAVGAALKFSFFDPDAKEKANVTVTFWKLKGNSFPTILCNWFNNFIMPEIGIIYYRYIADYVLRLQSLSSLMKQTNTDSITTGLRIWTLFWDEYFSIWCIPKCFISNKKKHIQNFYNACSFLIWIKAIVLKLPAKLSLAWWNMLTENRRGR